MSNKKLLYFQIFSAIFVIIFGSIFHFTFKWSENNAFIGLFSAVNESTWEHLKLLFFPMIISGIIGYFIFKNDFSNFLCSKTIGIIIALISTVTIFYTYTGIIGTNYAFFNIATFLISSILGEYLTYVLIKNTIPCNKYFYIIILLAFTISFIFFTFYPPKINLFRDPITSTYGIQSKGVL